MRAEPRDAAGRATTAEAITVAVSNDNVTPTVALTTESGPVAGSVTVTASASDDVGVVAVQFLLDGQPLGAEDTTPGYDLAWDTTTVTASSPRLPATPRGAAQPRRPLT